MKKFFALAFLLCLPAWAQSPESLQNAPRAVLLISADSGVEAVMPMIFTDGGKEHLEYIPASKIKESMDRGGKPIRLGDVLAALVDATNTINQLQSENEKLWKVATKDAPAQQSTTVIVQQTPPAPPSQQAVALQKYMLLRSLIPQTQNININYRNCTRFPAACVGR